MNVTSDYMDREQLAAELGIHVRTLDRWHLERKGPPRTTVGRRILYRGAAVQAWLRKNEQDEPRAHQR